MAYSEILEFVRDNGRAQVDDARGYIKESLIIEVQFEAKERGLREDEVDAAVNFALGHAVLAE